MNSRSLAHQSRLESIAHLAAVAMVLLPSIHDIKSVVEHLADVMHIVEEDPRGDGAARFVVEGKRSLRYLREWLKDFVLLDRTTREHSLLSVEEITNVLENVRLASDRQGLISVLHEQGMLGDTRVQVSGTALRLAVLVIVNAFEAISGFRAKLTLGVTSESVLICVLADTSTRLGGLKSSNWDQCQLAVTLSNALLKEASGTAKVDFDYDTIVVAQVALPVMHR